MLQTARDPRATLATKTNQIKSESNSWLHWAKLTAIGFASGAAGQTSIYAADTVKTRVQASRGSISAFQCCKDIYKAHGFMGFYRGVAGVSLMTSPEKALKLGVNDALRTMFKKFTNKQELPAVYEVISGGAAGMCQLVLTCPLEVCKIRMQLENKRPLQVIQELGVRGLYRGATACLARDVPFSMLYFPTYHLSKSYFRKQHPDGELSGAELVVVGLGSGTLAACTVTPLDVIKTRIQGNDPRWEKLGVVRSFKTIYTEEGFTALWKGLSTRLLTRGPQFAITVGAYEFLQRMFFGFVQSEQ